MHILYLGNDQYIGSDIHTNLEMKDIFGHIFVKLGLRKGRMSLSMLSYITKTEDLRIGLQDTDWYIFLKLFP